MSHRVKSRLKRPPSNRVHIPTIECSDFALKESSLHGVHHYRWPRALFYRGRTSDEAQGETESGNVEIVQTNHQIQQWAFQIELRSQSPPQLRTPMMKRQRNATASSSSITGIASLSADSLGHALGFLNVSCERHLSALVSVRVNE